MVKEKEWLSVEDIQKKVNSLDITRKEISKERMVDYRMKLATQLVVNKKRHSA